jgi:Gp5 N-terminal OB domain
MTEKNLGRNTWWVGEVVSVKDPDQSGRTQIRIHGHHDDKDNIPDTDLPWALHIQPPNSAAHGKVGQSPLGALKGTKVIGYWSDEDMQIPIIHGTIHKAGDLKGAEPSPGSNEDIDITTSSLPTGTHNNNNNNNNTADLNGDLSGSSIEEPRNAFSRLYDQRIKITDINDGTANTESLSTSQGIVNNTEVDKKLKEPQSPTTASLDKNNQDSILKSILTIDSRGISSVLLNCAASFDSVRSILNMNSINGQYSLSRAGLINAILYLMKKHGIYDVLNILISTYQVNLINQNSIDQVLNSTLNNANIAVYSLLSANNFKLIPYKPLGTLINPPKPSDKIPKKPLVTIDNLPITAIEQYIPLSNDQFPAYIKYIDSLDNISVYYTLRGDKLHYDSLEDYLADIVSSQLKITLAPGIIQYIAENPDRPINIIKINPNIQNDIVLIVNNALISAASYISDASLASALGQGVSQTNLLQLAAQLIPLLESKISSFLNSQLPSSVLNQSSVSDSMSKFTKNQALLQRKSDLLTTAVATNTNNSQSPFS